MIRTIVVDDEPPARREMRRLLAKFDDIKVVGEAGDLGVARGLLLRNRPELVFLDIRLGRQSGFDLLRDMDDDVEVVFVTAYDHYAVKAFEASALDYLLKPVDETRLRSTIERLRSRSPDRTVRDRSPTTVYASDRWIFVDSRDSQEFIELAEITHIEAEEGGTRVFTRDGRARIASLTLLNWEARAKGGDFVRVHRSALVNLRHVERVEQWSHYSYRLRIRGASEPIIMSRRHAARLRDLLG